MSTQSSLDTRPDPTGAYTHRQILTILTGLLMAMFLAALDQTVVSTAMRTIADDLHGFDLQAWATTAFLITSTISTPLYGKLSDMYGRKPFMLFAIAVFIIGSMLCGLSQSMYELAACRAIQGIGAGGLFSLALTIIGDIVPPRERAKYQGYFLAVFGTSSVLGPVLGGFFAGTPDIFGIAGWRWIFYINVPIAAAALVVVSRVLHLPVQRREHRVDWPGAIALVACLVPLLIVAEQGRAWGWGSARSLTCFGIGAVALVAFLLAERAYGDEALLPLRLFRGKTFSVASGSSFLTGMAMFGGLLLIPLYLQVVKGASPTRAGLELLPLVLGMMAGSIVSGQAISKTGRYKAFPIAGGAVMLVSLLLLSRVTADTALWLVMVCMTLMGLGLGWSMQPIVTAAQNAASPREMGVATSSVTFFRSMGGTIGAAAFLSVLFAELPGRIATAYTKAATTSDFLTAVRSHPDQIKLLRGGTGGGGGNLADTSFLNHLDPAIAHPFKVGFADTMSTVFVIVSGIMVVAWLVTWLLPEIPLSRQSAAMQRAAEAAADSTGPTVESAAPDTGTDADAVALPGNGSGPSANGFEPGTINGAGSTNGAGPAQRTGEDDIDEPTAAGRG